MREVLAPRRILSLAFLLYCMVGIAQEDKIKFSPEPSWVKDFPVNHSFLPDQRKIANGYYGIHYVYQNHLPTHTAYREFALRAFNSTGISEISDIMVNFDPTYQELHLHHIYVVRDGKDIDKTRDNEIQTHYIEEQASLRIYDHRVTAVIHVQDIRAGDVLVYAYSIVGENPVFGGRYSDQYFLCSQDSIDRLVVRFIQQRGVDLYHKLIEVDTPPEVYETDYGDVYEWDLRNTPSTEEKYYPDWYLVYPQVMVSEVKTWEEVNNWALQLFSDFTLDPAMEAWVEDVERRFPGLEERVLFATRWVQNEIRYLGLEIGENSHRPKSPSKVFQTRYGDCKDKSVLLCSLLRELGAQANPMLVSTWLQQSLGEVPPSIFVFNHCVVEGFLGGNPFYVDPTISMQGGSLFENYFPAYGYGLPVIRGNSKLRELPEPAPSEVVMDEDFYVDSVGGGGTLKVKTVYRGSAADEKRMQFAGSAITEIEDRYLEYYHTLYDSVTATANLAITDDTLNNELMLLEEYHIAMLWYRDSADMSTLLMPTKAALILDHLPISPSKDYDGPFELLFPYMVKQIITIHLPEDWTNNLKPVIEQREGLYYKYYAELLDRNVFVLHHELEISEPYVQPESIAQYISFRENVEVHCSNSLTYVDGANLSFKAYLLPLAALVVGLVFGAVAFLLMYLYDPPSHSTEVTGMAFGGWLLLPLLGLIIAAIRFPYQLLFEGFLDFHGWQAQLSLMSTGSNNALVLLLLATIFLIALFWMGAIGILFLFIKKRSCVPRLMIVFYVLGAIWVAAELIIYELIDLDIEFTAEETQEQMRNIIRTVISLFVWIPYFHLSDRVKNTFVRRLKKSPLIVTESGVLPIVPQSEIREEETN